jgi:hypothetical protein
VGKELLVFCGRTVFFSLFYIFFMSFLHLCRPSEAHDAMLSQVAPNIGTA